MCSAQPLTTLPEDILCLIAHMLARQGGIRALFALELTASGLRDVVSSAWNLAASTLAIDHIVHSSRALMHAVEWADSMIDQHAIESCTMFTSTGLPRSMHLALLPRGDGGWVQRFLTLLGPLGLACEVVDDSPLPPDIPFVLVRCDRALRSECPAGGHVTTWSCGHPRCMDPASRDCFHCGKHGAARAHLLTASCARQLGATALSATRRVLFVAPSPAVRDGYRRALVCLRRKAKH